jgi:hypothetical protein
MGHLVFDVLHPQGGDLRALAGVQMVDRPIFKLNVKVLAASYCSTLDRRHLELAHYLATLFPGDAVSAHHICVLGPRGENALPTLPAHLAAYGGIGACHKKGTLWSRF